MEGKTLKQAKERAIYCVGQVLWNSQLIDVKDFLLYSVSVGNLDHLDPLRELLLSYISGV